MPIEPDPPIIRVGRMEDLVCAVPHLLGFHPQESLVVVALHGARERLGFALRLDLPESADDLDVAETCAARMRLAGADAVVVFVFASWSPAAGSDLPFARLVGALQHAMTVPVRDAMLVSGDTVWSYLCPLTDCCPPEGRAVDRTSSAALSLAAAHAVAGRAVLADRDAVVRAADAVGGVTAASMRQAVARTRAARAGAGHYWSTWSGALERYDDPRGSLTHDEAAVLGLAWHDWSRRDVVLGCIAAGSETASRLVRDVARLMQPPDDAPAATMLAFVAYLDGCGVLAAAALERALTTDPRYSLAGLLDDGLSRQVPPSALRAVWTKFADVEVAAEEAAGEDTRA